MAHFLKGKFKGFYAAGSSGCVKDMFRFRKSSEGKLSMEVTRRDMESIVGRFWRYESASITLMPVDESEPRLGGKVQVKSFGMDFRTLTPFVQTQYGVYSDDFISFGTFDKSVGNPLEDEEILLKIVEEPTGEDSIVLDKTTFNFEGNQLVYKKEVNDEKVDVEVNHSIAESPLDPIIDDSWTETFFYGVGNTK
jgi:hypothetical protein